MNLSECRNAIKESERILDELLKRDKINPTFETTFTRQGQLSWLGYLKAKEHYMQGKIDQLIRDLEAL